MKPTKKQKKSIRIEETLRTLNFESGKHLVTMRKVIYDDGSYSLLAREESMPFFASKKHQDKLIVFCKQYKSLLEDLPSQKTVLMKSLSKLLLNLQSDYNSKGKDQLQGILEWSSHAYGFDFTKPKAKSKPKAKAKPKAVKDQKVNDPGLQVVKDS